MTEDMEAFSVVKRNPTRKVDADNLPPIIIENDGRMFFVDPTPTVGDILKTVAGLLVLTLGVFFGILGVVYALVTNTVNATILAFCTAAPVALVAMLILNGEKTNGHK